MDPVFKLRSWAGKFVGHQEGHDFYVTPDRLIAVSGDEPYQWFFGFGPPKELYLDGPGKTGILHRGWSLVKGD